MSERERLGVESGNGSDSNPGPRGHLDPYIVGMLPLNGTVHNYNPIYFFVKFS